MNRTIKNESEHNGKLIRSEEVILLTKMRTDLFNDFVLNIEKNLGYSTYFNEIEKLRSNLNSVLIYIELSIGNLNLFFVGIEDWNEIISLKKIITKSIATIDLIKPSTMTLAEKEQSKKDFMSNYSNLQACISKLKFQGQSQILVKLHEKEDTKDFLKKLIVHNKVKLAKKMNIV